MGAILTDTELASGLIDQLTTGLSAESGGAITAEPGRAGGGEGWVVTLKVTGERRGTFLLWVDRAGATGIAKLAGDLTPSDESIADVLREVWSQAASTLCLAPRFASLTIAVGAIVPGTGAGDSARGFGLTLGSLGRAQVAISGTFESEAVATETGGNLDLVLDIELPLVVRFGRTAMSLKALTDLGPGSIVDMGRSPDDPVELLVSDRVIARGEVVVVGGNYGVRVTDLVGSVDKTRAGEA
ncbi:MAG: FliM/FliN family flagellar motor switch protein [Acidobacteriota bacterium]